MKVLSVFITNLGKYNEGELVGKWIDLPMDKEEIKKAFDDIGINERYEEYFITDYESDYGIEIGEYENVYALSEKLEELENEDADKVKAMFESGWYSDIDEVIDNLGYVDFIKGWTGADYEEDLTINCYPEIENLTNSWIDSYITIDYEEMARDDDSIAETTEGVLYRI